MSIQYSGSTLVNMTFNSDGTRLNLVSTLATQLVNAGWSIVSGSGTADVLVQSAVTPQGCFVRFRLFDPGSGNCAQFTMRSSAGGLISAIGYMLPTAGKQFRIVANKYQFFFFSTGSANRTTAREVLIGGTLWVPDFIQADLGSNLDLGWVQYTGISDTGTVTQGSFRTAASFFFGSTLYKTWMVNFVNTVPLPGLVGLSISSNGNFGYRWQTDALPTFEPLMSFSSNNTITGEQKIVGVMFDTVCVAGAFTGESTISLDGHTWLAITDVNNMGNNAGKFSVFALVA